MGPHGEIPGRLASGAPPSDEVLREKTARIKGLYRRALSDDDIQAFAAVEAEFPNWELWPHIGWPTVHMIYARRLNTGMRVIMEDSTEEVRQKIKEWIADHQYNWA